MKKIAIMLSVLFICNVAFTQKSAKKPEKDIKRYLRAFDIDANNKVKLKLINKIDKNLTAIVKSKKLTAAAKNKVKKNVMTVIGTSFPGIIADLAIKTKRKQSVLNVIITLQSEMYKVNINVLPIINMCKIILAKSKDYTLIEKSARAVGVFIRHKKQATIALLAGLDRNLKIKKPTFYNIRTTNVILNSLAKMKHKLAFVSLLKVLNGSYPAPTKITAQMVLDNIIWD